MADHPATAKRDWRALLTSDIKLGRKRDVAPGAPTTPKKPKAKRKTNTRRFGLELDGRTLRAVELDGDRICSYDVVIGVDGSEAIRRWFAQRKPKDAEVRIVWAGAQTHLRRITRPMVPEAVLRTAMTSIADDVMPVPADTYVLAGVAFRGALPGDDGNEGRLVDQLSLVAVERGALDQVIDTAAEHEALLVPAELSCVTDGVYLAIRQTTAELVVVEHGAPVAARHLRCDGLDALVDRLSQGEHNGMDRLTSAMRGLSAGDAEAGSIIDAYINELIEDIRATTVYWQRSGLAITNEIFVFGAGAMLPGLPARLYEVAFQAQAAPLPPGIDVEVIAQGERFAAYGAVLAATYLIDDLELGVLPNPTLARKLQDRHQTVRRHRIIVAAGLTVAGLLMILLVPYLQVNSQLAAVRSDLADDEATLTATENAESLGDAVRSGQGAYISVTTGEIRWERVAQVIQDNVPAGVTLTSLLLSVAACPANDGTPVAVRPGQGPSTPGQENAILGPVRLGANQCFIVQAAGNIVGDSLAVTAVWIRTVADIGGYGAWPSGVRPSDSNGNGAVTLTFAMTPSQGMLTDRAGRVADVNQGGS